MTGAERLLNFLTHMISSTATKTPEADIKLPHKLRLDASTACQLRCPLCPTASGEIAATLGAKLLDPIQFESFLKANPHIREIELSNWGEVFLNPNLEQLLKIAHDLLVTVRIDNGVNLNRATPEQLKALVRYRVRSITCSIDGATQASYGIYRKNGQLASVIENILQINKAKLDLKSKYPKLTWQFVVFGHNEHELELAKSMAEDLDMTFRAKLNWDSSEPDKQFSAVKNVEHVKKYITEKVSSRLEHLKVHGDLYLQKGICTQLWNSPQVNCDGRLLGCCVNFWGDFGNVFESGFVACFFGEKLKYARQMLMGKQPAREDIPCTSCHYYKKMLAADKWIKSTDLKAKGLMSKLLKLFGS